MNQLAKYRVWDKDLCKYVTGAEFGLARMSIKPDEDDGRIFSFSTLFPGRYTPKKPLQKFRKCDILGNSLLVCLI